MQYNIKRAVEHRTLGVVHEGVHLVAEVEKVTINGQEVPGKSVEYLLNFALQSLQDSYAGAKTPDAARGLFQKRLDNLIAGTIGVRTGGTTERERVTVQVVRGILKAKLTEEAFAKYKEDDDAVLEAFKKNEDKLISYVDERIAELEAARARKAELAKSVAGLDL